MFKINHLKKYFILLLSFQFSHTFSQEIVNNGSFEWYGGWVAIKSVDFHSQAVSNQQATMGGHNGPGFCGIRSYAVGEENWQEYIYQGIANQMDSGKVYKVSFYYCMADMCTRTTDDFGVCFIEDPYAFSGPNDGWVLSTYTPQIGFSDGYFPTEDILYTKLSGYYKATGNEHFLVVGSFKLDQTLDTIGISSDYYFQQGDVYFFVDDISVLGCDDYPEIEMEDEIVICEPSEVQLNATYPGATYEWSTSDTSSAISAFISNSKYVSVEVTKNGCTYSDSTYVRIFDKKTDFKDVYSCDNSIFPIEIEVPLDTGETLTWEDGSSYSKRTINESGLYYYNNNLGNCNVQDTISIKVFENDKLIYPNPGTENVILTLEEGLIIHSIVSSNGDIIINENMTVDTLNHAIRKLAPGIYFLTVSRGECKKVLKYERVNLK